MVAQEGTHNWAKCKEYVSVAYSTINEASMSYPILPTFRELCGRGGRKPERARDQERSGQNHVFWMWQDQYIHELTVADRGCLYHIKPVNLLARIREGFRAPNPNWRDIDSGWLLREGVSQGSYLGVWSLIGFPCSSGWPHTHEYMSSTNQT